MCRFERLHLMLLVGPVKYGISGNIYLPYLELDPFLWDRTCYPCEML